MSISIAISLAALLVSIVGAGFSIYFNLRERARLNTESRVLLGDGEEPPSISITATNSGRRPLILRMWVGTDERKEWAGTFLGESKHGLRLGEGERFELILRNSDLGSFYDEAEIEFTELWFEDSLGRRHRIKDSRKRISEFWVLWRAHKASQEAKREMQMLIAQQVRAALKEGQSQTTDSGPLSR